MYKSGHNRGRSSHCRSGDDRRESEVLVAVARTVEEGIEEVIAETGVVVEVAVKVVGVVVAVQE